MVIDCFQSTEFVHPTWVVLGYHFLLRSARKRAGRQPGLLLPVLVHATSTHSNLHFLIGLHARDEPCQEGTQNVTLSVNLIYLEVSRQKRLLYEHHTSRLPTTVRAVHSLPQHLHDASGVQMKSSVGQSSPV